MKSIRSFFCLLALALLPASLVSGHCQIPCGIFDDDVIFGELMTDFATIEKAMVQITELEASGESNPNQLVRWVMNKETHAQNIQEVMAAYFLAQRIKIPSDKAGEEAYVNLLKLAHEVSVLAMKSKQTTDLAIAGKLHDALHAFQKAYSAP